MSWHRDLPPSTGAAREDARPAAGPSLQPEGSPQPNVVPQDDAAGSSPDQPADERPFRPVVVDLESVFAGELEVPADETPVSSGSALVVGPDGLLITTEDNPVLQQRPDVPLDSSGDFISFESSMLPVSSSSPEPAITSECV